MKTVQEKIQKSSRIISVFLKISEVAAIVGAVLSAAALVCVLADRQDLVRFFVDVGEIADPQSAAVLVPWLLTCLVGAMAITAAMCEPLYRMFRDISREGTPFAPKHARRIKMVAWIALVLPIVEGSLGNIHEALLTGEAMVQIGVDMMWLIFAGIIYCLAYIFDYGCQLQQESDETL